MEKFSYQLSDKCETFLSEQKVILGVDDILFRHINEFPKQYLYNEDNAYGTYLRTTDGKTIVVFLNPKRFSLHAKEERNYVVEVVVVHEILHLCVENKGFDRAESNQYPEIGALFTDLFHHRLIDRELADLGYKQDPSNRLIGEEYVKDITENTRENEEDVKLVRFGEWSFMWNVLQMATVYFWSNSHYEKACDLLQPLNRQLVLCSERCIRTINGFEVWKSPSVMFYAMKEVRDLIEPSTEQTISILNPDTHESV